MAAFEKKKEGKIGEGGGVKFPVLLSVQIYNIRIISAGFLSIM